MRTAVIGAGYVGLVQAAGLVSLGHHVRVAEVDPDRLAKLHRGAIPFYEPGLSDLVHRGIETDRLSFHGEVADAVADAEIVFIAVPTPSRRDGSADTSIVHEAVETALDHLAANALLVLKSTVPVGTNDEVARRITARRSDVGVVSNPEFLREGSAVEDFQHPSRIVVGSSTPEAADRMRELYGGLQADILVMDPASAELVKYASNVFLATKVSFANEIANLSERIGADVGEVLLGAGLDPRIGSQFMRPGPGYGGSCLPKDTRALMAIAAEVGYDFRLLEAVVDVNLRQLDRMVDKVRLAVGGDLTGRTVGLWGLAFKAGTDDTRESPALALAVRLTELGANVRAFDPQAADVNDGIRRVDSAYEAAKGADVLVVATEWPEFAVVDLDLVARDLAGDTIVDTRNVLDADQVRSHGLNYLGVGRSRTTS